MEVGQAHRHTVTGSACRRSLGGLKRSAGPDGRERKVEVSAQALAEALAILVVDLVGVLPAGDRTATLERLANKLDDQGRTPGGSEAAALLGAVGHALMRLEW
jgi:hypothetical protein